MATYLLDTNVVLRLCDSKAASFPTVLRAVSTLKTQGHDLYLTPQNFVEFWAVATRPVTANGLGWAPDRTKREINGLLDLFPVLEDSATVFPIWLYLVETHSIAGKRAHDARLVAVMQAHGVSHLLTLNPDDCKMFPGLTLTHPDDVTKSLP